MKAKLNIALVCLMALLNAPAATANQPARAPERIELRDQFDVPQRLAFPGTNVVVLVIADRKGSSQVQGWVSALNSRYAQRIDVRGLADVGNVPSWLRPAVRGNLRQSCSHSVMLDWTGDVAAALGRPKNEAVVLVIVPEGRIVARVSGAADKEDLKKVCAAIDAALPLAAEEAAESKPDSPPR